VIAIGKGGDVRGVDTHAMGGGDSDGDGWCGG
jgi:hypothetical protein